MVELLAEHMTGPVGGVVALAFGAGCAAGYSFASKLIRDQLNETRQQVATLKVDLDALRDEYRAETERLTGEHKEQLALLRAEIAKWQDAFFRATGIDTPPA